jgi:centrosomal protein CEP135
MSHSELKYVQLRERLDALHYTGVLTPDCVPLVEKLLTDLVRTTQGF